MKTIYILWLRQIKRHLRSKSRIIGSLAQPLLFLLSFGYGFGAVFRAAGQGDYINFLAPAIIGMSIIFTALFAGIELIWDRQFGFLKETLAAPVSRLAIMTGRTLGGASVATMQGVIVFFAAIMVGFHPVSWYGVFPGIVVMFVVAILFTALGTMIASLLADMQGFQLIMNFIVMPLFLLSGALFPLEGLPKVLSIVARCNPLSYGIDAFRSLLIGVHYYNFSLDITVISLLMLAFLGLGGYFFSKIQI